MANVVSNSLHNPVCAKQHTLKRQLGELPQIYVDSHGSGGDSLNLALFILIFIFAYL